MAGVLFIVIVPRKEHEEALRKKEKNANVTFETEKEKPQEIFREVSENKKLFEPVKIYIHAEDSGALKSIDCSQQKANCFKVDFPAKNSSICNDFKSNYLKNSWEELKQAVRPKKNKLKISSPYRGVDILSAFHSDTPLETILSEVLQRLEIKNASWTTTRSNDFWQVIFTLQSSNLCEETLQVLRTFGIGCRCQSSISVIPSTLYYKSSNDEGSIPNTPEDASLLNETNTKWSRFTSSVRARQNLAQVLHVVRADAALTFDWLFLLIVAAFVAAIGLVENSTVILVASMLISPLMGPITAGTLGTAVQDRSLQRLGLQNELLGLFLSLVIGFIFGLAICTVDERYGVGDWPTYEMMSRCEVRSLWVGVLVAIPSGAGVALAVLGEYTASLVGVAISASLLPPAVNAGLLWAMGLLHLLFMDDATRWSDVINSNTYSNNPAVELAVLGLLSLCLTLVNIVCIFLAGVAVYKVKEVSSLEEREIGWWRAKRNALDSSIRIHNTNTYTPYPPTFNQVIQSEWIAPEDDKLDNDKNVASPEPQPVQSDTITYRRRRPPPVLPKPKIQNIEAYLQRRNRDTGSADENPMEGTEVLNNEVNLTNEKKENLVIDKENALNEVERLKSFKNHDYEDINDDRATIQPSENYTVQTRTCGQPYLGIMSYDV